MAHNTRTSESRTVGWWRLLGLGVCAGLVLLLALQALRLARGCAEASAYPFELDYGEGPLLDQTRRLMAGEQIYRPIDEAPYTITNYPPVYQLVSGAFGLWIGDDLAAGRVVSSASAFLLALLIGHFVWRAASPGAGRAVRGAAAAIAALLFLRGSYTATWAQLMRVDLLADLFAFAGVVAFASQRSAPRRIRAPVVLFLLAAFTKQSTVAGAAACLVVAALRDRRVALRLLAALLGCGLAVFGVLSVASRGQFYFHVVTANNNVFSWAQAFTFLHDLATRHPVELAFAWLALPRLLEGLRRPREGEAANWERPVLGLYLITSFLACLTAGKIGSEINYLIEHVAVVATCTGVMVAEAFAPRGERRIVAFAALAVPALLLTQVATAKQRGALESTEVPSLRTQQEIGRVLARIEQTKGSVLSEDMTLLVRAGKPIELQPFETTQLARQGLWNPAPLLRRLSEGDFALIVLRFDAARPSKRKLRRFPRVMLKSIQSHYVLAEIIDGYWLYRPRGGGATSDRR